MLSINVEGKKRRMARVFLEGICKDCVKGVTLILALQFLEQGDGLLEECVLDSFHASEGRRIGRRLRS